MQGSLSVKTADGEMGGYLSLPEKKDAPGIVLIQEIFGVNDAMKLAADDLAKEGYVVFVPDLFWRFEPGIELAYTPEDMQKAFGFFQSFDIAKGTDDTKAALEALKGHEACNGTVAYLGFCLGGKLAVTAGALGGAAAAVSFYGVHLDKNHEELKALPCPIQIHGGGADNHVPVSVIKDIDTLMSDKSGYESYIYEGAAHAFFNKKRADAFDAKAHETATHRVLSFLSTHLQ